MTTTVSAYVFMSPVSSSMMAPASERIAAQFGVTNSTLIALQTSMFLGGYGMYKISDLLLILQNVFTAAGPLVLGPLSEAFGRRRILQLANFWYLGEPNGTSAVGS